LFRGAQSGSDNRHVIEAVGTQRALDSRDIDIFFAVVFQLQSITAVPFGEQRASRRGAVHVFAAAVFGQLGIGLGYAPAEVLK
jgi:hypothetical protein